WWHLEVWSDGRNGSTSSRGSAHSRAHGRGSQDDAADVAVAKAGREVAAVVAGQGAAEIPLRLGTTGAIEALAEDRLHRAEVAASIEPLRNRQAQAFQISDVDLRQADAEVPSFCL